MNKLIAILRKANGLTFKNSSEDQAFVKTMKTKFDEYRLPFSVNDDFSYFRSRIFYRGIQTKENFEKSFDATRNKLFEMWESLNFQERNRLANLDLEAIKAEAPSMLGQESRVWVPFFDDLLNSLYDRQIAIFELPQYFKLYRQFADKVLPLENRGIALWSSGFVDWMNVCQNEKCLVFFYEPLHCLFSLDEKYRLVGFPLSKTPQNKATREGLLRMGEAILENDEVGLIRALLDSNLVDTKTKVRIGEYLKKNYGAEGKKK